jgi:long-chain acyl-CoA synthetase
LAILKLGHIAMPLDPTFKKLEVAMVLDQIPPRIVVTNADYSGLIDKPDLKTVLFEDLVKVSPAPSYLRQAADKQIASLVFTSGSTGKPKAATYSHRNHIWNIEACSKVWKWGHDDSLLISLSLSKWYGLVMGLSGVIYHGNTMYLDDWFDKYKTLEKLASGKISIFTHISTTYYTLLEAEDKFDISKVRLCISGGAALPPAIWQGFKDRFGQEILEVYGSSETGRIASNLLDERIPGSPGRILDGVDLKFSHEQEVLIKSEGVFPGYYNNPQATKDAYTQDGYWRTGDIGELQTGRVILKGRRQERIRRFGYTISPRDVEWALHQNPQIKEVYVMGLQNSQQANDRLVYFINSPLNEDQIRDFCKQNLPFAWRADELIMVEAIPRTKNGKPEINKLRQLALDETRR